MKMQIFLQMKIKVILTTNKKSSNSNNKKMWSNIMIMKLVLVVLYRITA